MHSVKGVFVSLVLVFGFLTLAARIQAEEKKASTIDGEKRAIIAAVVKTHTAHAANSFGADTPADSSSSQSKYFDSEKVMAAFAKGGVLFASDGDERNYKGYRVAIRRVDKSDTPEMHHLTTHIFYVLDGSCTFVTGGTMINPKTTAPDTIRGTSIEGGETRHVSKGDVMIVLKGEPHWYKEVQSPFILFMVNVRGER